MTEQFDVALEYRHVQQLLDNVQMAAEAGCWLDVAGE